jgi:hypothetical protein
MNSTKEEACGSPTPAILVADDENQNPPTFRPLTLKSKPIKRDHKA